MIDRFNFFDIYGYLLPGGLLLALLWLPFALVLGKWPPADWGSAALALALAYACGHLLRNFAEAAFSSTFKDPRAEPAGLHNFCRQLLSNFVDAAFPTKPKDEEPVAKHEPKEPTAASPSKTKDHQAEPTGRYPSDWLLDVGGYSVLKAGFTDDVKDHLAAQILQKFNINVEVKANAKEWTHKLAERRREAFFSCRGYLIAQKAAAYAEQQQGMYELCRGIAAALALAAAYFLGLGLGFSARSSQIGGYPFVCIIALILFWILAVWIAVCALISAVDSTQRSRQGQARRRGFYHCAAALFCAGAAAAASDHHGPLAGFVPDPNHHIAIAMFVLAAVSLILALHCVGLFRGFAVNFAKVVYQDFYTLVSTAPPALLHPPHRPTRDDTHWRHLICRRGLGANECDPRT